MAKAGESSKKEKKLQKAKKDLLGNFYKHKRKKNFFVRSKRKTFHNPIKEGTFNKSIFNISILASLPRTAKLSLK